jgi:hypothetical protein
MSSVLDDVVNKCKKSYSTRSGFGSVISSRLIWNNRAIDHTMKTQLQRRHFLRGAGALIALPALESIGFRLFASAAPKATTVIPKRADCKALEKELASLREKVEGRPA